MREWGNTIAMDLIRWMISLVDSLTMGPLDAGNPALRLVEPLATATAVLKLARYGGRSSRGPTRLNRCSDL